MKGQWFKTQIINKPKDPKDKLKGPIVEETEILKTECEFPEIHSHTQLQQLLEHNEKESPSLNLIPKGGKI